MSFSKALLGLAAVTVLSSLASAQSPLSCTVQQVATPALRDNGVTERIGDLIITCSGGTPTPFGQQVPQFNLQIFTSPAINITSRILGGDVSEAVLLFDEPSPANQLLCGSTSAPTTNIAAGVCPTQGTGVFDPILGTQTYSGVAATGGVNGGFGRPNAFVARRLGDTSLIWGGLPFDPPGTGPARVMRITNVRVNASQLNNVRGGATSVNVVISTTPSGIGNSITVPITNSSPTAGIAQTPMDFTAGSASFLQCESQNISGGQLVVPGTITTGLTYSERFPSAFRRRSAFNPAAPASSSGTPIPSDNLANLQLFETESGFYKITSSRWDLSQTGLSGVTTNSTDNLGLASTGTRLLARFKNLPSGATLYLQNRAPLTQLNTTATITTGEVLATNADASGAGTFSAPSGTFAPVTPVSGTGTATWEVLSTATTVTEKAVIPWIISYTANTSNNLPTLGSATADGQLAPLSSVAVASSTATIPRFVEDSANNNKALFTINACRSNLLFPFVVNGSGYETGMAIVNTTKDPFGTQSQTGTCTVTFYGKSGTSDVCLTQTSTKSIAGGQFLAWTLGSGGDVAATPNFTGYAIAQCNFQYGHGFAFITDTLLQKVAHGYLALVMDDPLSDRGKRTGSKSESLNN